MAKISKGPKTKQKYAVCALSKEFLNHHNKCNIVKDLMQIMLKMMSFKHVACIDLFQPSTEMARAVTMESIGETAGAGSGPLPCHNTCRMELSPPCRGWSGVPTGPAITAATAGSPCTGPAHLRHSHHRLPPLQAVYRPYPLPCLQPEGRGEQQSHQQGPVVAPAPTPLSSPPCSRRDEAQGGSISGQLSGKNIIHIFLPIFKTTQEY